MTVVLVLAVWLGWYLHTVRTQQAAVRAIKEAGGWVVYDWDWANYDPNITSYQGKPRAPKWLCNLVGVDYGGARGQTLFLVSWMSWGSDLFFGSPRLSLVRNQKPSLTRMAPALLG